MTNRFEQLTQDDYDEWEGQFSCSTYLCNGYAKRAKYFANKKLLVWVCQDGHQSKLENIDE